MTGAVVVRAQARGDAELVGELVHGAARQLQGPLHGCGVRGPVGVLHDVVEGLFDGEGDAGLLLELRAHHERAAGDGAVGDAHVAALLDDDDRLAGAHGLHGRPHTSPAGADDGDVAFLGLVGGLHGGRAARLLARLGEVGGRGLRGAPGQGRASAQGGDAAEGQEAATGKRGVAHGDLSLQELESMPPRAAFGICAALQRRGDRPLGGRAHHGAAAMFCRG